jgi:hypothetical protein
MKPSTPTAQIPIIPLTLAQPARRYAYSPEESMIIGSSGYDDSVKKNCGMRQKRNGHNLTNDYQASVDTNFGNL